MKPSERQSRQFLKVFDGRGHRVRGLWKRGDSFYAQLAIPDPVTGLAPVRRTRLEDKDGQPVVTVSDAVKRMHALKTRRDEGQLKLDPRRTPTLAEYVTTYLSQAQALGNKRPETMDRERGCLRRWAAAIGHLRLRQITKAAIIQYMVERRQQGCQASTVNVELIPLRNLFRAASEAGYLTNPPTTGIERLKHDTKKKRLVTHAEIDAVCAAAIAQTGSGQQLADLVRFIAYSGARHGEALRVRWSDVDFPGKQLTIGADGKSKNGESRTVDFNARLERCLMDMATRRQPDSTYLFPSPYRGETDVPVVNFGTTFRRARATAGVAEDFNFHALRHFFISASVMAGIDYMTITRWAGHKDGGVLIGKVYGHLSNAHAQAQAARVNFGPAILPLPQPATA